MRELEQNVPGIERTAAIATLGQRDIGHIVTIGGKSGVLMQVMEYRHLKGNMPYFKYRARIRRLGGTSWADTSELDASTPVEVGRKYVPRDSTNPFLPSSI